MASHNSSTPIRELPDSELRKRLLTLGYDVPVSVNREFLVQKLEKASAGGQKSKKQQRHSMAASVPHQSSPPPPVPQSPPSASASPARKRKSMAAMTPNSGRSYQNNVSVSTPMSPLATSSPLNYNPGTPQYMGSPGSSIGMSTPSTPSPFVSRLNTPSPGGSPSQHLNNGESGGSHSPRYMNYYNMFKASSSGGGGGDGGDLGGGGGPYGYAYNRGIRMGGSFNPVSSVAPPSSSSRSQERNGYGGQGQQGQGGGALGGIDPDWCGGHLVSKILVIGFVLFFMVIGGLYISKNMGVDPRGLTASENGGNGGGGAEYSRREEPPKPPPTPAPQQKKKAELPPLTTMVYPVCGLKGVDPEACIPREVVKNSRALFNTLKEELTQRARKMGCNAETFEGGITLQDAKTALYKLSDLRKSEIDSAFQGMLLLVTENPRGGLSLHGLEESEEIASKDVMTLDPVSTKISATGINPDFICVVRSMLFSLTLYITVVIALSGSGYLGWKGYQIYKSRKESEHDEIYRMVERVLELLRIQWELSENSQGTPFLAVNHIRDELVPPRERSEKEAFWNKVVNHISNAESRVREEIQHISGEEFRVWRWLPSASPLASRRSLAKPNHRFSMPGSPMMTPPQQVPSTSAGPSHHHHQHQAPPPPMSPPPAPLYPSLSGLSMLSSDEDGVGGDDGVGMEGTNGDTNSNNKWQGQAFETCEGSPNALPATPTTCLKIRHMFTERDGIKERARIEKHILEKCTNARILHIGIDTNSVEGCVYVRCFSKDDARLAFMALHGWWFEGKLLSVKFLREERYFSRFPEAKKLAVPLTLAR